jgi:5'-deoxynucleotidase YfbR-like HD superfamily hydrolase
MDTVKSTKEIMYLRKMLNIQRLTGTKKHRSYNLAEHSYYVGILFHYFAKEEGISVTDSNTLMAVLLHDYMEVFTVDLPYHVKNLTEKTKQLWADLEKEVFLERASKKSDLVITDYQLEHDLLTVDQFKLFKACDLLELWIFLVEEYEIGNQSIEILRIMEKCEEILQNPSSEFYYESIKEFMNEY